MKLFWNFKVSCRGKNLSLNTGDKCFYPKKDWFPSHFIHSFYCQSENRIRENRVVEEFFFILNILCWLHIASKYRLELPKLCYHPGWRLMRLGYRTCFHTLCDVKKKKKEFASTEHFSSFLLNWFYHVILWCKREFFFVGGELLPLSNGVFFFCTLKNNPRLQKLIP